MGGHSQALSSEKGFFSATEHVYKAYGLEFLSQVRVPHFLEAIRSGEPDVRIRRGEIFGPGYKPPESIQIDASPGRLLLRGARSATILVTGGNSMKIEPLPNGNAATIMQILLGWGLGGLFHQRNLLPLHASALCRDDDCFVLCAPSGGGKSTLTASFLNRGFSFLDDNIALVDFEDRKACIASGSPELRLWERAMPVLDFEYETAGPISPDMDKISIIARRNFRREKACLRKIFVLKRGDGARVSFIELTGAAKFQALLENVFFVRIVNHCKNNRGLFRLVCQLGENAPVTEIRLPARLPPPDDLRDIILGACVLQ